MKQHYIKPQMTVVETEPEALLAGSAFTPNGNTGDPANVPTRRKSVWDDEDDL